MGALVVHFTLCLAFGGLLRSAARPRLILLVPALTHQFADWLDWLVICGLVAIVGRGPFTLIVGVVTGLIIAIVFFLLFLFLLFRAVLLLF